MSRSGLLLRLLRCDVTAATAGNSRWSAAGVLSSSSSLSGSCGSARLLHLNSSQVCLLYTVLLLIGVADPGSGAFLTPGSGIRFGIRDEQPGSYFRELRNNFLW